MCPSSTDDLFLLETCLRAGGFEAPEPRGLPGPRLDLAAGLMLASFLTTPAPRGRPGRRRGRLLTIRGDGGSSTSEPAASAKIWISSGLGSTVPGQKQRHTLLTGVLNMSVFFNSDLGRDFSQLLD